VDHEVAVGALRWSAERNGIAFCTALDCAWYLAAGGDAAVGYSPAFGDLPAESAAVDDVVVAHRHGRERQAGILEYMNKSTIALFTLMSE
jgi:hypothetical protein